MPTACKVLFQLQGTTNETDAILWELTALRLKKNFFQY